MIIQKVVGLAATWTNKQTNQSLSTHNNDDHNDDDEDGQQSVSKFDDDDDDGLGVILSIQIQLYSLDHSMAMNECHDLWMHEMSIDLHRSPLFDQCSMHRRWWWWWSEIGWHMAN